MNHKHYLISLVFIFAVYSPFNVMADEPNYTRDTAEAFFQSKEHIAIIMRIDGGISLGDYLKYLGEFNMDVSAKAVTRTWSEKLDVSPRSNFIVLKNIKGKLDDVIQMPNDYANKFKLKLGVPYLVFLDKTKDDLYSLENGEKFFASDFSVEVLNSSPDVLIDLLMSNLFH